MGPDAVILVFWVLSFKPTFSLSSHFHQEAFESLFTFCHKNGVICVSEVIDISSATCDLIPATFFNSLTNILYPYPHACHAKVLTVLYNRNPKKLPPPTKKLFQSHANMLWDAMLPLLGRPFPSPHPHIFLEDCFPPGRLSSIISFSVPFPWLPPHPQADWITPIFMQPRAHGSRSTEHTVLQSVLFMSVSSIRWGATEFLLPHQSEQCLAHESCSIYICWGWGEWKHKQID